MSNLHPIFESILHAWEKPHPKQGEIGQNCTICGNPALHAIHSSNTAELGDRLVARKSGSCITVTDMDSDKSITLTPMSLDSLIEFYERTH